MGSIHYIRPDVGLSDPEDFIKAFKAIWEKIQDLKKPQNRYNSSKGNYGADPSNASNESCECDVTFDDVKAGLLKAQIQYCRYLLNKKNSETDVKRVFQPFEGATTYSSSIGSDDLDTVPVRLQNERTHSSTKTSHHKKTSTSPKKSSSQKIKHKSHNEMFNSNEARIKHKSYNEMFNSDEARVKHKSHNEMFNSDEARIYESSSSSTSKGDFCPEEDVAPIIKIDKSTNTDRRAFKENKKETSSRKTKTEINAVTKERHESRSSIPIKNINKARSKSSSSDHSSRETMPMVHNRHKTEGGKKVSKDKKTKKSKSVIRNFSASREPVNIPSHQPARKPIKHLHKHIDLAQVPFILGTSTSSHSIVAGVQSIIATLKTHNALCQKVCDDPKPVKAKIKSKKEYNILKSLGKDFNELTLERDQLKDKLSKRLVQPDEEMLQQRFKNVSELLDAKAKEIVFWHSHCQQEQDKKREIERQRTKSKSFTPYWKSCN